MVTTSGLVLRISLVSVLAVGFANGAAAQGWVATSVHPSLQTGIAYDVSDSGQTVGYQALNATQFAGFSWTPGGGLVDVGTLGGTYTLAQGVNNSGLVVGYSRTTGGAIQAFTWTPGGGSSISAPKSVPLRASRTASAGTARSWAGGNLPGEIRRRSCGASPRR